MAFCAIHTFLLWKLAQHMNMYWILSCHGCHLLTENENISLVHEFEGFLCVCFVEFLFLTFLHWGKNDSPSFRERFMSLKTLQRLKLINKVLACCWSCSISCLRNALENSFHIIFSLQYHKSPQSHLQHAQSLQRAGKDTGAFSANKQDLFPQELLAVLSTRLFYRMHCSVLFPPNYPKYFDSVAFLSFMLFFASLPSVRLSCHGAHYYATDAIDIKIRLAYTLYWSKQTVGLDFLYRWRQKCMFSYILLPQATWVGPSFPPSLYTCSANWFLTRTIYLSNI